MEGRVQLQMSFLLPPGLCNIPECVFVLFGKMLLIYLRNRIQEKFDVVWDVKTGFIQSHFLSVNL